MYQQQQGMTLNMMSEEAKMVLTEVRREMGLGVCVDLKTKSVDTKDCALADTCLAPVTSELTAKCPGENYRTYNSSPKESRAPYFHTAARADRKKTLKGDNEQPQCESLQRNDAVVNYTRPFEITPMGYDSRYSQPTMTIRYNSDDEEEIVSHIMERSVEKCQQWLNNHTTRTRTKS